MCRQQKFYSNIECCPVNHFCIPETKEDQEPNPVALQILLSPKKISDH